MITFSDFFYKKTKLEIDKKSESTEKKLISIYQGEIVEYQHPNDFDICKKQLLQLLKYIYNLNPKTLEIFSIYARTIEQELSSTSSLDNIKITLKAAKKSIEASIFTIEENCSNIDAGTFSHCIADKCIPGAFFYIENVLEYFHQNHFSLIVTAAKKQLLRECITQFVHQQNVKIEENYEIHYINGLYNLLRKTYGCSFQKEPLATREFEEINIIKSCEKYVKKKFTVPNFIKTLMTFISPPPNEVINNQNSFSKIDDFFNTIGLSTNEHVHLYFRDDDDYLHPKQNFDIYVECLIAYALKKYHYIEETDFIFNKIAFFDNGSSIVRYDEKKQYLVLSNDQFLSFIEKQDEHCSTRFIHQLNEETLYQKFISEDKKDIYFYAILNKSTLSDETVINLYQYLLNNSVHNHFLIKFVNYLFSNLYPLSSQIIVELSKKLTSNKKNRYFKKAIMANQEDYIYALLPAVNNSSYHFAAQIAAERSNQNLLKAIHELVDINTITTHFEANTLAHIAIMNGNIEILKTLYSLGINLEIENEGGYNAIHYIFRFGKVEILEWFVKTVRPNLFKKVTLDFYTLIHQAADQEQAQIFEWIRKKYPKLLCQADKDGHTIAHWATYNDDVSMLKWLDLNTLKMSDNEDYIPILFAVQNNHLKAFKWILRAIPEQLNHTNQSGHTIAHFAAHHSSLDILDFILHHKPTLLAESDLHGNLITHIAADNNCLKTMDWILTYYPSLLESANYHDHTIAHIAAHKAHTLIIQWIEKHNLNLFNQFDKDNYTPIHLAARQGHLDILLMFHQMPLQTNWYEILNILPSISKNKETLVHLAVRARNIKFLNLLSTYRINVNKPDKFGWPPIFFAFHQNNEKLFHKLIKMGASLNVCDNHGNTLAHNLYKRHLSREEENKWINILKQYNFNFDIKNNDGKTHADLANQKKAVYHQLNINHLKKNTGILYYFDIYNRPKKINLQKKKKSNLNLRASI